MFGRGLDVEGEEEEKAGAISERRSGRRDGLWVM